MADGSSGHQVERLDVRAFELVGDLRREFLAHLARGIDAAHKAVSGIGQFADYSFGLEFAQARQRKYAIVIGLGVGGPITEMPYAKIVVRRIFRDRPVARILAMKARLVTI